MEAIVSRLVFPKPLLEIWQISTATFNSEIKITKLVPINSYRVINNTANQPDILYTFSEPVVGFGHQFYHSDVDAERTLLFSSKRKAAESVLKIVTKETENDARNNMLYADRILAVLADLSQEVQLTKLPRVTCQTVYSDRKVRAIFCSEYSTSDCEIEFLSQSAEQDARRIWAEMWQLLAVEKVCEELEKTYKEVHYRVDYKEFTFVIEISGVSVTFLVRRPKNSQMPDAKKLIEKINKKVLEASKSIS